MRLGSLYIGLGPLRLEPKPDKKHILLKPEPVD